MLGHKVLEGIEEQNCRQNLRRSDLWDTFKVMGSVLVFLVALSLCCMVIAYKSILSKCSCCYKCCFYEVEEEMDTKQETEGKEINQSEPDLEEVTKNSAEKDNKDE